MRRTALFVAGAAAISACGGVSVPFYGFPGGPPDLVDAEVEDADPVFPDATTPPDAPTPDAALDASLDAAVDARADADAADAPSSD
jgi:hypothetical protein